MTSHNTLSRSKVFLLPLPAHSMWPTVENLKGTYSACLRSKGGISVCGFCSPPSLPLLPVDTCFTVTLLFIIESGTYWLSFFFISFWLLGEFLDHKVRGMVPGFDGHSLFDSGHSLTLCVFKMGLPILLFYLDWCLLKFNFIEMLHGLDSICCVSLVKILDILTVTLDWCYKNKVKLIE